MAVDIRFVGAVGSRAYLDADRIEGRIGFDETIGRAVLCYDGTNWAENARRDVEETFAAGIKLPLLDADTVALIGTGGTVTSEDYPTFLATVGAEPAIQSVTREMVIQTLPLTNAAPDEVNVVDANMKSYGFDGATQIEELYYHIDLQHDYVAGTDLIWHIHWVPSTAGGGNVKFQIYYQWVEAGGVFPAATLSAPAAVAAGTTAWADKRTDFTLSGSGHTYNSRLLVKVFRDPTDAADTYAGDAVLTSMGCHYTALPTQ